MSKAKHDAHNEETKNPAPVEEAAAAAAGEDEEKPEKKPYEYVVAKKTPEQVKLELTEVIKDFEKKKTLAQRKISRETELHKNMAKGKMARTLNSYLKTHREVVLDMVRNKEIDLQYVSAAMENTTSREVYELEEEITHSGVAPSPLSKKPSQQSGRHNRPAPSGR